MNLIFNSSELTEVLKNFNILTNLRITIFDSDFNEIISYPESSSSYCELLRKNEDIDKQCKLDNLTAYNMCKKSNKSYTYRCSYGLTNIVTPIKSTDSIIAYIAFGQALVSSNINYTLETISKAIESSNISLNAIDSELSKLQQLNEEKLLACTQILDACASYLYTTQKLKPEENNLALKIDSYIKSNLADELTVPLLCDYFNIGKTTFYKLSKEYFGMGLSEYIKKVRLKKSKEYLLNTSLPISEISSLVGIQDYNYFSKAFKAETNFTPRDFRKRYNPNSINIVP